MILFYGWLAITVFIITVGLAAWYQWQSTKPEADDEVWIDEEDERREPNWRRV